MLERNLESISHISRALWGNEARSDITAQETLATVSMMDLDLEKTLERTSSALLEQAKRDGPKFNLEFLNFSFYRLPPEDRFILSALHRAKWSYERVARVLGTDAERVARRAWSVRQELSTVRVATGSFRDRGFCPDYNPLNPWTQRFLDQENTPEQTQFLQNHTLQCERCRQALRSARELYYSVDALIPRGRGDAKTYSRIISDVKLQVDPTQHDLRSSLRFFFSRSDIQLTVAIGFVILAISFWL